MTGSQGFGSNSQSMDKSNDMSRETAGNKRLMKSVSNLEPVQEADEMMSRNQSHVEPSDSDNRLSKSQDISR